MTKPVNYEIDETVPEDRQSGPTMLSLILILSILTYATIGVVWTVGECRGQVEEGE